MLGFFGSLLGGGLGALFAILFENLALGPDGRPRFPVNLSASLFLSATAMATGVGLLAVDRVARATDRRSSNGNAVPTQALF